MTQHNITGSEAFAPKEHVLIGTSARERRRWHPAVKLLAGSAIVGLIASLIDSVIGAPVCLALCAAFFVLVWAAG